MKLFLFKTWRKI